ncbi:uncharacterized protein STEHIDRAFT_163210 [Stereum hirsutum FP-91666 SS1]|uniref:Uncharacterized protein n=1 Tax=Stereum hirsutum (strain FP-91666) TaxID=721885 RepID=R7RYH5_STEHR|nr:uncharacterized protein STEHIDRAFT_163210 [Stereum hirsutum FP-91666 SS1]EIM79955.1 hypothetical protein STEHIDRAFT_163210 [Stereum hirsutum FP-91666 SS1]
MAYRFRGSEASSLLLTSTSLRRSSGFFTFISALETCAIFMPMRVVEPLSQLFAFIVLSLCVNRDREKLTFTRRPGGDESMVYEHTREGRTISVSTSSVNRGMVSAMGAGNGSQDARERQRRYIEDHRMYELEDATSGRRKGRRSTTVG